MCFSTVATYAHNSLSGLLHFFNTGKPLSITPVGIIFLQVLLTFSGPQKITHKTDVQLQ
jgi:hypothetical protein